MYNIIEEIITEKIEDKAKELGIEFKVQFSIKKGLNDLLIRIKRVLPETNDNTNHALLREIRKIVENQNKFSDFVTDIVLRTYSTEVRFTYPKRLI